MCEVSIEAIGRGDSMTEERPDAAVLLVLKPGRLISLAEVARLAALADPVAPKSSLADDVGERCKPSPECKLSGLACVSSRPPSCRNCKRSVWICSGTVLRAPDPFITSQRKPLISVSRLRASRWRRST
jgi:hypothetical protein